MSEYCSVSVEAMAVPFYTNNYDARVHWITKEENKDDVEDVKAPELASFEFINYRDHTYSQKSLYLNEMCQ